uniref:Uncharacterized protein LOC111122580 n=1 Tax=Crassostrea virginica TaxID=6565 RepID=A0A8B8CXW1_CRAVI|nr:uncharacterized protein LOC111122580 [Crassostrea virginica]
MRTINFIVILLVSNVCYGICKGWILHAKSLCMDLTDGISKAKNITITYTIRNHFIEPWFEHERNVTSSAGQPFIRFMEQAATDDVNYEFSSRYQSKVGYVITELGKDRLAGGSGFTSWQLTKAPSTILPIDVSRYIPEGGDHLVMDYVIPGL